MDFHERKRLQNKLSQRKHRQKQKQRIEELELELSNLKKKLNQCLYQDQSKVQLLKIYKTTQGKVQKVNQGLEELQNYLKSEIFSSIQGDLQKLECGEIVLSEDEDEEEARFKANLEEDEDFNDYSDKELVEDEISSTNHNHNNNVSVSPATADAIASITSASIPSLQSHTTTDKMSRVSSSQFSSFQTPSDFNLNDFGIFDFGQKYQNPVSKIDPNSVLKYYIYNDICIHPSNLLDIINGIGIQSISYINKIQQEQNIISSPHFLNMVCQYANNLFEQIPKFKNYAFAFGGVKWLVGQVLFFGLTNPNIEPLIKPLLFQHNNFNQENYQLLVNNITKYLEISWLKGQHAGSEDNNTSLFLLHSDTLFPTKPIDPENSDSDSFILHEWFYPTALQTYLLKHKIYREYPHWVNFLIWPEMRDILLTNIHKLTMGTQDIFYNDLMDSVVLVLKDQPMYDQSNKLIGKRDKLFFFVDLTNLITLTINSNKVANPLPCEPKLEYLTKNGLYNPKEWKLTRTYARKFGSLIPKDLVTWDIDDTQSANIIRPHYVS